MEFDLTVIGGLAVWHLAMLNSLALYSGAFTRTAWIAPSAIIFSPFHKLGVLALCLSALVTVTSARAGWLDYGIWAGGALAIADAWLTYRAYAAWMRSH